MNGKVLDSPALTVGETDDIVVDGKTLQGPERTRLFQYHKPPGLLTTHKDDRGRPTIFDDMPDELPRVITVGRLDLNTEGLLLLTNDGELARYLELPSTGWLRSYRVRVYGDVKQEGLDRLKQGITVEGMQYKGIKAELEKTGPDSEKKANQWLRVSLREGKNREVRKAMEAIGLEVNRLIRISYGPFTLGKMPRQSIYEVPTKIMKDQIKGFFKS